MMMPRTRPAERAEPIERGRVAASTRQVVPFAVAGAAAPLVAVGSGGVSQDGAMALGFALLVAISAAMVMVLATSAPRWLHDACVFGSLAALTLMVYGAGGPDSGAALVLLLPVVWMALYGDRVEVLVTLALMLTALIGLTVADTEGALLPSDLRRIVVFLTVPALTAWTVSSLMQRLGASEREARQGQAVLEAVAKAAREIREAQDGRRTACEALVRVSQGSSALLLEPDGADHLVVTTSVGTRVLGLSLPLDQPSAAALAFTTGLPVYVADTRRDDRVSSELMGLTGAGSVLVQPFRHGGSVRGVVEVVWPDPRPVAEPRVAEAVTVLVEEIGSALERSDLLSTLRRRATTDPLTGLSNRRVWRERLPELMAMPGPLSVAVLDLDLFKAYNDSHGHLAGDGLLQALGKVWLPLLRPQDMLVRWGGEEFALALPECPLPEAHRVLERLRAAVPSDQTVSAGIACWDGSEPIESLMARADAALYEAKSAGRNRVVAVGFEVASGTKT